MLGFFSKKKVPDQAEGISFLTTQGMSYHIEEMFLKAENYIFIVAPYIKIHNKLRSILKEKHSQGLDIVVVCRENDLKDDLNFLSSPVVDSPRLHAKCYLTDKCALIGSLNLYDFSQVHNDEMGILVENYGCGTVLYEQIKAELYRLADFGKGGVGEIKKDYGFVVGKKYSFDELDGVFDFDYKKMSGIKKSKNGEIVLFSSSSSKYFNKFENNKLIYQGQNTGPGDQRLVYGNKDLHDSYGNGKINIYLFIDFVYKGRVFVASEPFKQNGIWHFPLSKKS